MQWTGWAPIPGSSLDPPPLLHPWLKTFGSLCVAPGGPSGRTGQMEGGKAACGEEEAVL